MSIVRTLSIIKLVPRCSKLIIYFYIGSVVNLNSSHRFFWYNAWFKSFYRMCLILVHILTREQYSEGFLCGSSIERPFF